MWYMVFDKDPHGNRERPLYFLQNLYAQFILHKHVNYFDILDLQGGWWKYSQYRKDVRVDPNRVCHHPLP